jgi:protocatechuate 3,4-dioxygenase beta subunit
MAVHRRQILRFGAVAVAGRLVPACSSSGDGGGGIADSGGAANDASDGVAPEAGVEAGDGAVCLSAETTTDASAIPWASGGTTAMTGKANYPNPFAAGCNLPASCVATCELTQGPCYSSQSVEIQDISYGYAGLPMRMYLQVLDESCKPVSGAVVDVWHVSPVGKYSGDDATNEDVSFCTGNDSDFTSHLYFRGKQTTDAAGVVFFDTCFPGWYSSRTVHIHLTIRVGSDAYVTTQLCFDDSLDDDVIASQAVYDTRGKRDTTNSTDTVFSASTYTDYEFQIAKMADGAMLAWKTIVLRSSLAESICGGGGSMGEGGPPPGFEGGPPPGFDGGPPPGFDGGPPPGFDGGE